VGSGEAAGREGVGSGGEGNDGLLDCWSIGVMESGGYEEPMFDVGYAMCDDSATEIGI
jgi:hypothetical protein